MDQALGSAISLAAFVFVVLVEYPGVELPDPRVVPSIQLAVCRAE